jgi:hypothetical protein
MSFRLRSLVVLVVLVVPSAWCPVAGAGTGTGASGASGASGADGGNTVSVGVSTSSTSSGGAGSVGTGAGGDNSGPTCTYTALPASFGPGGQAPGRWYIVWCPGEQLTLQDGGLQWVPDVPSRPTPIVVATPGAAAARAEASIVLPTLSIGLDPVAFSVVNLPTWLWVDPASWHPFEATATVGGVTASAVATPESVTWTMGDGGVVECAGPGTPYRVNVPAATQSTSCSYVYRRPSEAQAGVNGGGNNSAFVVRATVTWRVTWSAVGAAGGGVLPPLQTSATTLIRVEQVESVGVLP